MYDFLENENSYGSVIGSFARDNNSEFKDSVKHLFETFHATYQLDAISDIARILKVDSLKEAYKQELLGDVMENIQHDEYQGMLPQKIEQLFENTAGDIIKESHVATLQPIVGLSLPILKKSFIEGHAKDIVMTEVPTMPIVKVAFERKFLKDIDGNKHYIPEIFYNGTYTEIMAKGRGKAMPATWYPESGTLPMHDFDILTAAGGDIRKRDTLALNFCIKAVKITVAGNSKIVECNVQPNFAANSTFNYKVVYKDPTSGVETTDTLFGQVDEYFGRVSAASSKGLITHVQFGGNLSNQNNTEAIELDMERNLMEWKIPDGDRINTGLTVEKIKDYKALFDYDITTDIINTMSEVLTQTEDSNILKFLDDSFDKNKALGNVPIMGYDEGFIAEGYFQCDPPANKMVTRSQYIDTELKYDLNRFIDGLKVKLRTQDLMFVIYGHPNNITLIQDNAKWVIEEDTKIGGIQLDYKFGVMTANKNRIHVISTLKCKKENGLRVVAYPLSKDVITFKHLKYAMNIENSYRNPITPLINNIMATSRYLTTEVLPVQGKFNIMDGEFSLRNPATPATSQVAPVAVDKPAGTYTGAQNITVTCPTPGVNIYYTTNGTDPTVASTLISSGNTITVSATSTVKFIAMKPGMIPSGIVTVAYTIN